MENYDTSIYDAELRDDVWSVYESHIVPQSKWTILAIAKCDVIHDIDERARDCAIDLIQCMKRHNNQIERPLLMLKFLARKYQFKHTDYQVEEYVNEVESNDDWSKEEELPMKEIEKYDRRVLTCPAGQLMALINSVNAQLNLPNVNPEKINNFVSRRLTKNLKCNDTATLFGFNENEQMLMPWRDWIKDRIQNYQRMTTNIQHARAKRIYPQVPDYVVQFEVWQFGPLCEIGLVGADGTKLYVNPNRSLVRSHGRLQSVVMREEIMK